MLNFLNVVFNILFDVSYSINEFEILIVLISVSIIIPVRTFIISKNNIPTGWVNAIEAIVKFIRDSIVRPNVGDRWVMVWTPLILTFFYFIYSKVFF